LSGVYLSHSCWHRGFDITLAASNEYGAMAGAKLLGVEILNEGTGVSIDDTD
jgi:hypothetical protein